MGDTKIHTCIIVDDSEQDVFLAERMLKKAKMHFQISHYTSAQAILDASLEMDEALVAGSVIFVDRYLGNDNGIELLKTLRQQSLLSKAIIGICSGSDNIADIEHARRAESSFFVEKPLDIKALESVCEAVPGLQLITSSEGSVSLIRIDS